MANIQHIGSHSVTITRRHIPLAIIHLVRLGQGVLEYLMVRELVWGQLYPLKPPRIWVSDLHIVLELGPLCLGHLMSVEGTSRE